MAMLMGPGYWSGVEIVKNGNRVAEIRSGDSAHWSMSATVVTAEVSILDCKKDNFQMKKWCVFFLFLLKT